MSRPPVVGIEAVTFDFWNTLVVDGGTAGRDHRLDAWMGVLEDSGFAVERGALDAAMAASWDVFLEAWRSNRQYTHVEAAVDILDQLGHRVPPDVHDRLLASFHYDETDSPSLTEGVAECLAVLHGNGVRLGIICDVGMTPSTALRDILSRYDVLQFFSHWSFSDEVGAYKPAGEIFAHALAGLGGVAPAAAAHVGDLKRTDVAGALAFGMTAVRYAGSFDDSASEGPEATFVIASHADLPGVLGLG
ncbi:MAG TPA: HAD family hydrolase [Acidimicrobiales bacterium]|nr:HAD family hydrolase [Acidimicrobiales bacterium]